MNTNAKKIGLVLGPTLFVLVLVSPSPSDLPESAKIVLAIAIWMIVWWVSEAISVYATALLPLVLMPMTGVMPLNEIATEYMHPIVILLLGMFLIAIAVEKSELHRKIAFTLISLFGYKPDRIIWGFMISTALISMVIMSTTAVLIMLPIAFVIMRAIQESMIKVSRGFTIALMLGIAYASSIGSVAILIGAPPNLIYAGTMAELFNHTVTFAEWSILGAPLSAIMLVVCGMFMVRKVRGENESYNLIREVLIKEKEKVNKITRVQITVLGVLVSVLVLMFTTPLWLPQNTFVTNSVIAMMGGIALFVLPKSRSEGLLDWLGVEKLPFGLLFLLGGGLALSLSFINSGLAEWLAGALSFIAVMQMELVVVVVVALIMLISNVKSNTAAAAIFIPVVANMAILNGWPPLPILFAITVATSFAFLLPMGTPPNALVYERAKITTKEMLKNGVVLNMISIGLITIQYLLHHTFLVLYSDVVFSKLKSVKVLLFYCVTTNGEASK